jgi:multicomponent K+:H+ antiporter subunit D
MNHWAIAPVLLPLAAAVVLVLAERAGPRWSVAINLAATLALLAVALRLLAGAAGGEVAVYLVGNWPAPFGIALAVDRLGALMIALAAALALAALGFALSGEWARAAHFHPLFQLQLMGLNGAFATADLFNLFVFFEVLLIASYGLLLHAPAPRRVAAGLHYVILNLAGSSVFLIAIGLLYGVTGTLNLADLSQAVRALPAADVPLARAAGLMLLVVFGLKAALLPLYFWLPGTYASAPAPVAALFAIMTKVGVYAIVRVFTLVFGADAGGAANLAGPVLLPLALATLLAAALGALAAARLRTLASWLVVASAGTLLSAVGLFSADGVAAALYYLVHSTLAGAALFLIAELVRGSRGALEDRLRGGMAVARPALLGALFFAAAVALAGLPPLSGFLGKLLVLQGALPDARAPAVFAVVLGAGLLVVMALSRAGSRLFWNTGGGSPAPGVAAPLAAFLPVALLLAGSVALAVLAAPVRGYAAAAAQQLLAPDAYVASVLNAQPVSRELRP